MQPIQTNACASACSIKSIKVYHQSNQSLTSGKQCTVVTGKNGYTKCKCIPKIICNHNHNTSNTNNTINHNIFQLTDTLYKTICNLMP